MWRWEMLTKFQLISLKERDCLRDHEAYRKSVRMSYGLRENWTKCFFMLYPPRLSVCLWKGQQLYSLFRAKGLYHSEHARFQFFLFSAYMYLFINFVIFNATANQHVELSAFWTVLVNTRVSICCDHFLPNVWNYHYAVRFWCCLRAHMLNHFQELNNPSLKGTLVLVHDIRHVG
jgi:hypothetical protein